MFHKHYVIFRELVKKQIKARDNYGLVFDDVKKMEAMKQLRAIEAGPNPPPPGTTEDSGNDMQLVQADNAMMPYADVGPVRSIPTSGMGPTGQIQPLRKAPTMPKPKWHAPWKLYRVIAGHLGNCKQQSLCTVMNCLFYLH